MEFVRPTLGADVLRTVEVERRNDGAWVMVAGWPVARQHPRGQDGTVFVTIEDETGDVQVIIWPDLFARCRRELGSQVCGGHGPGVQVGWDDERDRDAPARGPVRGHHAAHA